jgi:glutathione S-transferase
MLPYILNIYVNMLGEAGVPLHGRVHGEVDKHFGFLETEMTGRDFVVGNDLTGADFQLTFLLEGASLNGQLDGKYPALNRYFALMQARPAYKRAIEVGGSYDLRRLNPKPVS